MKLKKYHGFNALIVYLNTNGLCIEAHPVAKSTLGEPEPCSAIAGSDANFWGLEAILVTHLGANRIQ
jgi:hypothetical protein